MTIVGALGGVAVLLGLIVVLAGADWLLGELLFLPGKLIYQKLVRSPDERLPKWSQRIAERIAVMLIATAFWGVVVVAMGYGIYGYHD